MVDVGAKPVTRRIARAEVYLLAEPHVLQAVQEGSVPKGNVVEVARIAGIGAAKRTWELIPLCHQLPLDHVDVQIELQPDRLRVVTQASTRSATGVEMEALTAASIAGLTLYDMLKALSKTMQLTGLRLLYKSGGRSGEFSAEQPQVESGS